MEQNNMSKTSAASLKAIDKYKKANISNVALQFNRKTEPQLTEYVLSLPNKTAYIKNLIRADMGAEQPKWTLWVNDEDETRHYQLHAHTEAEARAEAEQIINLFSGWLKCRIDTSDWHIIESRADDTSWTGVSDGDTAEPIYLFREESK